ncbi:MAG: hypothetical protein ACP5UN_03915, partial [Candidatus Micrarchaeia archaeon]
MGIDPLSINFIFSIIENINKNVDETISNYFNRYLDNIIKLSMLYKIDEMIQPLSNIYNEIKFINTSNNLIKVNN